MSRDGDFYIDNLTFDFYLHEAGMWVLKGNIFPSGAGAGTGDVTGPASALDGTPTVFNGTTGKLIENISYGVFKTNLALTKGDVGLANVDNTSDASKPISTATQTALDDKATGPASVTDDLPAIFDGTTGKLLKSKTYAAFKTLLALVKGDVGLGSVDNTADVDKPISTATQTALDAKVAGPVSVTDDLPAVFDLTTGKLIKSKTYAAFKTLLALVKGDVGLGSVDNTADVDKPISTATQTALDAKVAGPASVTDGVPALYDGTTGKLIKATTFSAFKTSLALTKSDVGLANVDNTSDIDKPVSTAQTAAINALLGANDAEVYKGVIDCSTNPNYPAADAGHVYRVSVAGKIGGASGINVEINDRLQCIVDGTASGDQATVGTKWWITQANIDGAVVGPTSVTDDLPAIFDGTSGKLIKSKTYAAFKTLLSLVKGDVGLGNVDNTSDANKPVSTATQTALDLKVTGPAGSVTDDVPAVFDGTTGELIKQKTYAAFKTLLALVKGDVGLGNVDNTSDANKPVSTATQTALDLKLNITDAREVLSASRTYYVRTDGSDSNTGLVDSAGGAFLTIQKAIDMFAKIDVSTFACSILVRAGTYTGQVVLKDYLGAGTISLTGDTTTPSNVHINYGGAGDAISANSIVTAGYRVGGFKVSSSAGQCLGVRAGATLIVNGKMEYGVASVYHMYVFGSYLQISADYTISGGALRHIYAEEMSSAKIGGSNTITLTGTPAFSSEFVGCTRNSLVSIYGNTFSGAATGKRFGVTVGSVVFTNTTDLTYLPGSVAGTFSSGGQIDDVVSSNILPQNSRSAAYTTIMNDAYKHIFHPSADVTARTWTIDSNANVPYVIGTNLTFINQNAAGVITIAITTDTMRLSPGGTTGSRTLAANGKAVATKVTATEWIISGSGLT